MNSKYKKLELCWPGKDFEIKPEPRVLIEDPEKSYGETDTENMLIHADNLLALKALEQNFSGRIKCIYIDPPYNTGNAFEHYDDGLEHSIWLNLMQSRLEILYKLLDDDGRIFVQIDDSEQAYLRILLDEIFGRNNFINTISVNMKNIAGASGGGEDKKLKKNIEYIHIYTKNYSRVTSFENVYEYIPIHELVQQYREEEKSWKYTSVLVYEGDKEYIGSTVDGDGNEIKIFSRTNYVIKTISQLMADDSISEEETYKKYSNRAFQTQMPQSSIRPRVSQKVTELGVEGDLFSIEYVPKTGRNRGKLYEQYYKGDNFRLLAWLSDVSAEVNGVLCKKEMQGTYWNFVGETKNLTKEGNVQFPNGKKPEALIYRIFQMATKEGDIVLDSFLGSGTTIAVANKMGLKWIGIELGNHANTHCLPRLKAVCDGTDQNGISKTVDWKGGGGFKFYNLAPSLLNKDKYSQWVINPNYNAVLLAAAMARHEGFTYSPEEHVVWKQGFATENHFIFTTTNTITPDVVEQILREMKPDESLLICCTAFIEDCNEISNRIEIKKIPEVLLGKCEFGKEDYCTDTNIINMPADPDKPAFTPSYVKPDVKPEPANIKKDTPTQTKLLF